MFKAYIHFAEQQMAKQMPKLHGTTQLAMYVMNSCRRFYNDMAKIVVIASHWKTWKEIWQQQQKNDNIIERMTTNNHV